MAASGVLTFVELQLACAVKVDAAWNGRLDPVLNAQPGDAPKLSRIVRHETYREAEGMSSDQEIHRSDRRPFPFKRCTESPIGSGGIPIERCDFERREKLGESETILCGMPALTHAIIEFRYGDAGDSDVTDRMREKSFECGRRVLLDEIDADIGVQHQFHAKGRFRF